MDIQNYCNDGVRRRDRLLDAGRAAELLRTGEYAVLSMVENRGGTPAGYGIPVSFVWDGGASVYIHCAPEGHKLGCLDASPGATLCVVGATRVVPRGFTTEYESVLLRGTVSRGLGEGERMEALRMIVGKYSPGHEEVGMKYAAASFHRTEVLRFTIESASGKCKRVAP